MIKSAEKNVTDSKTLWQVIDSLDDHTFLFPGWTARSLCNRVQVEKDRLIKQRLRKGETIGLRIKNQPEYVIAMLSLICAGGCPLLISHDAPELEARRLCKNLGIHRSVEIEDKSGDDLITLKGEPSESRNEFSGIILTTSGSTGFPKTVECSETNLIVEGYRYFAGIGVHNKDRVVLPLPLSHAYGMGWLMGNLMAGACTDLLFPTALGAIEKKITHDATIVALTPTLARLLSIRPFIDKKARTGSRLRLAMVGAGPVDTVLEKKFKDKFGIALSRNYGSTETGTTFVGFPPLPPNCVGKALPGVKHKIIYYDDRECKPGATGILAVTDLSGNWHITGDLAIRDESDRVTIIGRKSKSIRRGDRWISPSEIESVLFMHPDIKDVHVHFDEGAVANANQIIANVVPVDKLTFSRSDLLDYARNHLAPYKLPDVIKIHDTLTRSQSGKIKEKPKFVPGEAQFLLSAARAYKRSELLFSLFELGILRLLDGRTDLDKIAETCGLNPDALESMMAIAESIGLVSRLKEDKKISFDPEPYLALEADISRNWSVREEISDIIRKGFHNRRFDRVEIPERFIQKYNTAMHGEHVSFRILYGLRSLRPKPGCRILEITTGPGRYLETFLKKDKTATGVLNQQGVLSGEISDALKAAIQEGRLLTEKNPEDTDFDICIVNNAIHNLTSIDAIRWLLDRIATGGRILIDDIFLPAEGIDAEIGVDWFTHGGISFKSLYELEQVFTHLGYNIRPINTMGNPLKKLIIIKKETN